MCGKTSEPLISSTLLSSRVAFLKPILILSECRMHFSVFCGEIHIKFTVLKCKFSDIKYIHNVQPSLPSSSRTFLSAVAFWAFQSVSFGLWAPRGEGVGLVYFCMSQRPPGNTELDTFLVSCHPWAWFWCISPLLLWIKLSCLAVQLLTLSGSAAASSPWWVL